MSPTRLYVLLCLGALHQSESHPALWAPTNYHSLVHPSLPNYIAATSGLAVNALGPLRNDCNATGPCHTRAMSIFAQAPS